MSLRQPLRGDATSRWAQRGASTGAQLAAPAGGLRSDAVALRPEVQAAINRRAMQQKPPTSVYLHDGPAFAPQYPSVAAAPARLDFDGLVAARGAATADCCTGYPAELAEVATDAKSLLARAKKGAGKLYKGAGELAKKAAANAPSVVLPGAPALLLPTMPSKQELVDKYATAKAAVDTRLEKGVEKASKMDKFNRKAFTVGEGSLQTTAFVVSMKKKHNGAGGGEGAFLIGSQSGKATFVQEDPIHPFRHNTPPKDMYMPKPEGEAKLNKLHKARLKKAGDEHTSDYCNPTGKNPTYSDSLLYKYGAQFHSLAGASGFTPDAMGFCMTLAPGSLPWGMDLLPEEISGAVLEGVQSLVLTPEEVANNAVDQATKGDTEMGMSGAGAGAGTQQISALDPSGVTPYLQHHDFYYPKVSATTPTSASAMKPVSGMVVLSITPTLAKGMFTTDHGSGDEVARVEKNPCMDVLDLPEAERAAANAELAKMNMADKQDRAKYLMPLVLRDGKHMAHIKSPEVLMGLYSAIVYQVHVKADGSLLWGGHPIFVPQDEPIPPASVPAHVSGPNSLLRERTLTIMGALTRSADLLNYRMVFGMELQRVDRMAGEADPVHIDLKLAWVTMVLGHGMTMLAKSKVRAPAAVREELNRVMRSRALLAPTRAAASSIGVHGDEPLEELVDELDATTLAAYAAGPIEVDVPLA